MTHLPDDNHLRGTPDTPDPGHPEEVLQPEESPTAKVERDRPFLGGPLPRLTELGTLFRVVLDFIKGFRALHFVGPCVTVFGSARTPESDPYYQLARKTGAALADLGFTVLTGGGPGIMEAANRGAKDVNGHSVGCNIELAFEQDPNPWLDRWITMRYFFVRKTLLIKYSYAFVVLPGGFGTLDEMFEALTLIQTGKIKNFPVILMGRAYWSGIIDFIHHMAEKGTISPNDIKLLCITDSVEEAMAHIRHYSIKQFGLTRSSLQPTKLLGEQ